MKKQRKEYNSHAGIQHGGCLSFAGYCFTYFNKTRQVLFEPRHKISLK